MKTKTEINELLTITEAIYKKTKKSNKYLLLLGQTQINVLRNVLNLKPIDWNKEGL